MESRPRLMRIADHRRLRRRRGRPRVRMARASLATLLGGAVVSGMLVAAPAWAAPPPLQAPPAAPPPVGPFAVTTAKSPFPFFVTEVAPGIGVYQGRIVDGQTGADTLGSLPDGASPVNREFLDRVTALIQLLDETPEGHRIISDLGRALPLPDPGSAAWGATFRNPDGTPSRIRVLIGTAPGYGSYGTLGLAATRARTGLGSDSIMGVDPTFPLNEQWRGTRRFAASPVVSLGHELVHAWRLLMGAYDSTEVLETHRYNPDNPAVFRLTLMRREELRAVGNPESEVYDPATNAPVRLGTDTALAESRRVVDALVADYRSAGDQASVQRLEATRQARTPASGSAPTERNIAVARGELQRTHYVGLARPDRPFVLRANDTLLWRSNLALITPDVQWRPDDFPNLLQPADPPPPPPPCSAPLANSRGCTGKAYEVQPTFVLQVQSGSDTCLRGSAQILPELYPCNGTQSTQRWTFHPESKLLSIGGDRMTEVGTAPRAPALCLTGNQTGGSRLELLPCSLSNPKQRWEYTTTGLWRAVGGDGKPYGCLNAQGNRTNDGTPVILWNCDKAGNGTWNFYRGHLDLGGFQIAATTGAPMEALGDEVTTSWDEKSNTNTAWTQTKKPSASTLTGYYALRNTGRDRCLVANRGTKLGECGQADWDIDARWSLYQHGTGMFTLQTDAPPKTLPVCAMVDDYAHLTTRGCIYVDPWFNNKYWNWQWRIVPTWGVVDRA